MCRTLAISRLRILLMGCWLFLPGPRLLAERPNPVLQTVFPAGGQAGTSVTVTFNGSDLEGLRDVHTTIPNVAAKGIGGNRFVLNLPTDVRPGIYDLRVVGTHGMSSPRAFFVSNRSERLEVEPNDEPEQAQAVPLDVVVNGCLAKPGDMDFYRFEARAGQRVVLECWADRIDSQLRAVLEVYDSHGKRLAANRGHAGVDPLVDFVVPAVGTYLVKIYDLSFLGSTHHFYRLDIDTKPRPEFALPCVVPRGRTSRVRLFGRNLLPTSPMANTRSGEAAELDSIEINVTPPSAEQYEGPPLPRRPCQVEVDGFPVYFPGCHAPVLLGVTDLPVVGAAEDNGQPDRAQEIPVPCEVSGRLAGGGRHWYAVRLRRGEVLWLDGFGERIGSPVDLDVTVLDSSSRHQMARLTDNQENLGGYRFATNHVDPSGRWVAPADGRYLILVRNLAGNVLAGERWPYRLSVRREEPGFDLAVVSRRTDQPAGLNVCRGGREWLEVLALCKRGFDGVIRVSARDLPPGIRCPDICIGPGQERAPLVVTADSTCVPYAGALHLVGHAGVGGAVITRVARGGSMTWPGRPTPSGRLTQEVPLATGLASGLFVNAVPSEAVVDQDSTLDLAVDVDLGGQPLRGPINLTGVGLPRQMVNATASIPADKTRGWISFYFPPLLPPGSYTLAIQAEAELLSAPGKATVMLVSDPVVVRVRPARIALEMDPRTPRKIARGKIVQLRFKAERKHGFIGKIHAELTAPGGVIGLQARGLTLVSQAEEGAIQVLASNDAPLGRPAFLQLQAVGTVEDQPTYRASRFVELEITERRRHGH